MAIDLNSKPYSVAHMGNMSFDAENQKNQVETGSINPATGKFEPSTIIDPAQKIIDESVMNVVYVGENSSLTALTSDNSWIIQKIDTSVTNITTIKKTTGVWDDRITLFG